MCCVGIKESSDRAYDDLTKIGQEDAPFFCEENNVYVAFEFASLYKPNGTWSADPSDALKAVKIYRMLDRCL